MSWPIAAAMIGGSLLSTFGGGEEQQNAPRTYTSIGMPAQYELIQRMVRAANAGAGEFGFAPAARSMNATLQQNMANSGISQDSGVAQSALAQALASAASQDAGSRRNFALGVSQASPWTLNYQNLGVGWEGANQQFANTSRSWRRNAHDYGTGGHY